MQLVFGLVLLASSLMVVTRCGRIYGDIKDNSDKIQAGLDAGTAIMEFLGDDNFSDTFGKIGSMAAKLGPFLGAIGPVFALINVFLPGKPSAELAFMKKKFAEMDRKFDQVFNQFRDVKYLIEESTLNIQYAPYEHTVIALSKNLHKMLAANISETDVHRRSFITHYESGYNDATNKLLAGMMETNSFMLSKHIPTAAMKYTENNRKRVQNIMKGMTNLILQGVKVELGYFSAKNLTKDYNVKKRNWENKINALVDVMKEMDELVTEKWHSQMTTDVERKLVDWKDRSNKDFASQLYDFLVAKFDWKDWLVVSYEEYYGGEKHWVSWSGGFKKFRAHGRNLVISSVDRNKPLINWTRAFELTWFYPMESHPILLTPAEEIFKSSSSRLSELRRYPYAAFCVIHKGDVHHKAKSNRLSTTAIYPYIVIVFG